MCCGATLGIHPLSKDFITFILGILRLQFISFSGWFVYDCSDLYDETNVYFRGLIILETLSYFFTIPQIAVKTLEIPGLLSVILSGTVAEEQLRSWHITTCMQMK